MATDPDRVSTVQWNSTSPTLESDHKLFQNFNPELRRVFVTVDIVLSVLITATNGLVLVAFFRTKSLRTVLNYYVISVIMADIFAGIFVIPAAILAHHSLVVSNLMCKCFAFFLSFVETAAVYSMVMIAIDRYYRFVIAPTRSSTSSRERIVIPIALTWTLATVYALKDPFINEIIVEVTYDGDTYGEQEECWIPVTSSGELKTIVALDFLLMFVIPLAVVSFCYLSVSMTFREPPSSAAGNIPYKRKAIYVHVAVVMTFLFTECGLHVIKMVVGLSGHAFENQTIAHEICTSLGFAYYCMNAVLYGFLNKNFRKALMGLFRKTHSVAPIELDVNLA